MYDIYCFGDSITRGEYDISHGGWAERLKAFCMKKAVNEGTDTESMVYNLGISGETSRGCLRRIESEFAVRKSSEATPLFIFAYGANDAAFLKENQAHAVSVDEFAENLLKLTAFAKNNHGKVIFLTITPVVENCYKVQNHPIKIRNNVYIKRYNEIIKRIALSEGLLIDVYSRFIKNNHEEFFIDDGVHPNASGHGLISDLLIKTFIENQILS